MGEIPESLLPHEVTLEYWTGVTGTGVDTYASPVTVPAYVEPSARLTRDPNTGDMVSLDSIIYMNLRSPAPSTNTRVTLPNGRTPDVIEVKTFDFGDDSPTPDHLEILCK